jgi:CelD/BcsL family acetyltransferase involved in cellulose biosynthesis
VFGDMAPVERDWRAFEKVADGTVFQSFDWLSTWQRCIGSVEGASPVIVIGRDSRGEMLFLMPLTIERSGFTRRLSWLGTVLCDYNGPLLAPDFEKRFSATEFQAIWHDVLLRLRSHPALSFDVVAFDKMQRTVGPQANPFMSLGVQPHANGAYRTALSDNWEKFYNDKRSSATRRRDRTKRKKMGEAGEVKFVTPADATGNTATLKTLMAQKTKSFAAMGVADIFARPGYSEFYQALAAQPAFVHVSRLDVGNETVAANLGMIFRDSYYHLLASYTDGELSKFGPGAAHMHDLLRYAIEHKCHTFDFTIGDERYKQEWCEGNIVLFDHFRPMSLRGVVDALRLKAVGRGKHFIKQTPALWNAAYKVRAFIGPMMKLVRR